jgi:hypothetical protein
VLELCDRTKDDRLHTRIPGNSATFLMPTTLFRRMSSKVLLCHALAFRISNPTTLIVLHAPILAGSRGLTLDRPEFYSTYSQCFQCRLDVAVSAGRFVPKRSPSGKHEYVAEAGAGVLWAKHF